VNRRLVLVQTAVFAVVAVLVGAYALFELVGFRVVDKPYPVTVELRTGGGVFAGSEVTYRGVAVGTVSDVELKPDRVVARLSVEHDRRIPADAVATVTRLSAVGEQYLDFQAPSDGGPYLAAGAVVPMGRTAVPPETASVLASVNALVGSLDPDDLGSLSTELSAAFGGADEDLRTILDSGADLLDELHAAAPSLSRILTSTDTILGTASDHTADFGRFADAAAELSRTLKNRTPDIAHLVGSGVQLSRLADQLIAESGSAFTLLMANLVDVSRIQAPHLGGWQALLVAVADFEHALPRTIRGGVIQANLLFDYNQPVCRYASEMTSPISGTRSPLRNVSCPNPAPGTLVRGAQNAPR
jgi:phospholipid/cholesterol/gamma-HCH transport system substrate-binding protein